VTGVLWGRAVPRDGVDDDRLSARPLSGAEQNQQQRWREPIPLAGLAASRLGEQVVSGAVTQLGAQLVGVG
jgi:hypothetical protein